MDFCLTEAQERFKDEVCRFLDKEVNEGVVQESESGLGFGPYSWELLRKLGARGWLTPSFPKEYGGLGLSRMYRYIVLEELDYRNALVTVRGYGQIGADMAGPTILHYGSEELKREILPKISRGEVEFALGYTEPEAGSDLSRIEMRALEQGDEYVVSGQKRFNTTCHYAQYHWLCARTDLDAPRHRGLSMFVVDMNSPGITLRPQWEMADRRTNEVFYDKVRVPKRRLVGEKNRGFYYMASALDRERMITVGGLQNMFDDLVAYSKEVSYEGKPLCKNILVRQKLADMFVEISVARKFAQQVAYLQDRELTPNYEVSVLKVFISELYQRLTNTGLQIMGLYGQLQRGSKWVALNGIIERQYRGAFMMTLGGGSTEMMKNIIATRGLGLPKG